MMKTTRMCVAAAWVAASLGLSGCAAGPKPLYAWGSYPEQVYRYYKGEDRQKQIAELEADGQRMASSNATPPPGWHAHLGMLYAGAGHDEQARAEFNAERQAFPESSTYMDSLLAKYQH